MTHQSFKTMTMNHHWTWSMDDFMDDFMDDHCQPLRTDDRSVALQPPRRTTSDISTAVTVTLPSAFVCRKVSMSSSLRSLSAWSQWYMGPHPGWTRPDRPDHPEVNPAFAGNPTAGKQPTQDLHGMHLARFFGWDGRSHPKKDLNRTRSEFKLLFCQPERT